MQINYNFPYWGQLVYKVSLDKKILNKLKKLCNKDKTKDARHTLAGILDHEYLIDHNEYQKLLQPYLNGYVHAYEQYYRKNISGLKCNSAWVNYMQAGDFNPMHKHVGCDFSSVIYTQIPSILTKENKLYKGRSSGPGSIIFYCGESREHSISEVSYFPKVGDMFIFPYNMIHCVLPFKSKCERISIAANFIYE